MLFSKPKEVMTLLHLAGLHLAGCSSTNTGKIASQSLSEKAVLCDVATPSPARTLAGRGSAKPGAQQPMPIRIDKSSWGRCGFIMVTYLSVERVPLPGHSCYFISPDGSIGQINGLSRVDILADCAAIQR